MKTAWGVAAATSLGAVALMCSGVASAGSAPNVVGQKFSDARSALANAGFKPLVSTTVGDQLQWPNCVVTNQVARTVSAPANSGGSSSSQVLLSLNCEAAFATPGSPGNSLGMHKAAMWLHLPVIAPDAPRTQKIIASVPVKRVGEPEDVSHAAAYLLDARSGFVTGQVLYVCGGMTVGVAGV